MNARIFEEARMYAMGSISEQDFENSIKKEASVMQDQNGHSLSIVKQDFAPIQERHEYDGLSLVVTPEEARRRVVELQYFFKSVMIPDLDYGIIPGTPKPTLLQPGAQKLGEIYGLVPQFDEVSSVKDWDKGFFYYECKCKLISRRDGKLSGEGIGSCNSKEKRYQNGIQKGKMDVYSLVNTIQKMAAKRAFVHAILGATRSAGIFTQDLEDMPSEHVLHQAEKPQDIPPYSPPEQAVIFRKYMGDIDKSTTLPELACIWSKVNDAKKERMLNLEHVGTLTTAKEAAKRRIEPVIEATVEPIVGEDSLPE